MPAMAVARNGSAVAGPVGRPGSAARPAVAGAVEGHGQEAAEGVKDEVVDPGEAAGHELLVELVAQAVGQAEEHGGHGRGAGAARAPGGRQGKEEAEAEHGVGQQVEELVQVDHGRQGQGVAGLVGEDEQGRHHRDERQDAGPGRARAHGAGCGDGVGPVVRAGVADRPAGNGGERRAGWTDGLGRDAERGRQSGAWRPGPPAGRGAVMIWVRRRGRSRPPGR